MAVKTKEELLESFRGFGLEEDKPEFIRFLEDMEDSFDNSEEIVKLREENSKLQSDLEVERQRYVDRFFGRGNEDEPTPTPPSFEEEEEIVMSMEDMADYLEEVI